MLGFRRSVACRAAVALLTDYLEGALSVGDRRRLEAHLAECPYCREYLEQLRLTIEAAGVAAALDDAADDIDDETAADLAELYRRWRDGDDPR